MPLISENRILPMDAQEIKRALCMYVVRIDHDLLATEANQVTSQWSRVNPSSKFAESDSNWFPIKEHRYEANFEREAGNSNEMAKLRRQINEHKDDSIYDVQKSVELLDVFLCLCT